MQFRPYHSNLATAEAIEWWCGNKLLFWPSEDQILRPLPPLVLNPCHDPEKVPSSVS